MFLVYLALLQVVGCLELNVEGDLAFDMRILNWKKGKQVWFRQGWEGGHQKGDEQKHKIKKMLKNYTVAPEVECIYQYPEQEHINSLLSNMMNELTKVFVQADEFTSRVQIRRGNDNTRFRVIHKKEKDFFEVVYANMTDEYRNFSNTTVERVDRTGLDPCQHQEEIKEIWRTLLEHSLKTLKKAAYVCMDEYLRDQQVELKSKIRTRLGQYLKKKLSKARSSQLSMLCDTHQLCYDELLQ